MKILIYGSKGWIGNQIISLLKNNHEVLIGNYRLENEKDLENEILSFSPDRIISVTGRTHGKTITTIDYLEQKGKLTENIRDNLFGPMNLALISLKLNIHITYFGTGCIFNYDQQHPKNSLKGFSEKDKPNFFGSSYSVVKGFTDQLMHTFDNVLNIRIRMPITDTDHPRNFITKIITYQKICSIPNSMTVLPELLPIMINMVEKKKTGTINLTNPGVISHNEILEMYRNIVDPNFKWNNFTIEEQDEILLSKRSNNMLDTSKLESMYNVKHIKNAVRTCLENLQKKHFYPKNILVTGGCGFIGSNFLNYFGEKYPDILLVNIDKIDYCSRIKNVILKHDKYVFCKGDIKNKNLINNILNKYQIDTVIHFAAQSHVDNSFKNSIQFTEDNILGTHVLLECCHHYGQIKRFIHMSTDEVYGEVSDNHSGCNEISLLNPTNPYAATKAGAEFLVRSYNYSFQLPIIIIRGNNVYGPRQYPEKLIPKFILQLKNNKKCTIHGKGKTKRNFIHVEDVCSAIEIIIHKGVINEIYNIGTNNEFSVMDISKLLINAIHPQNNIKNWIEYIDDRNWNDSRYHICSSKLHNLGWKEKINFFNGLKLTIDWYLKNLNYFTPLNI